MGGSRISKAILGSVAALLIATAIPSGASPESPSSLPSGVPKLASNDFIFFPLGVFHDPVMRDAWYESIKRSRVALSNGYAVFEPEDRDVLQQGGTELFLYRWFNGYYALELLATGYYSQFWEVTDVFKEINRHPDWLINPLVPVAGGGATTPAYFFDWSNPDLRAFYISKLVEHLDASGYDGVFFDYIGDWALPDAIKALWSVKHPNVSYNEAGLQFITELRAAVGARKVFGNQAYKLDNAPGWYRQLDYDITESIGTSHLYGRTATVYVEGKGPTQISETYYRPWDDDWGYRWVMEDWSPYAPMDLLGRDPIEFFHVNYAQPWYVLTGETTSNGDPVFRPVPDRPAIHYAYALGKLHDLPGFASDGPSWAGDHTNYVEDEIYQVDLGEPVDATYVRTDDAVLRYFENGVVVVTRNNQFNVQSGTYVGPWGESDPVTVGLDRSRIPSGVTGLYDVYARAPVQGWPSAGDAEVVITPDYYPATETYYPSGRVYMYTR